MKTLIIIPAYNEEESILKVIRDVKENGGNVDYIVINDCSTDSTKSLLEKNGIEHIDLPINLGIGGCVQTGYKYALANGYDIAVQLDGDGQHDASYIQRLIEPIENGQADFVVGSRFIDGNGFQSSRTRRIGINIISRQIKLLSGLKIRDVTSGMRACSRQLIEVFTRDYADDYPEPGSLLTVGLKKAKVVEVPVKMRERQGGISSISPLNSVYYMVKVCISLVLLKLGSRRDG